MRKKKTGGGWDEVQAGRLGAIPYFKNPQWIIKADLLLRYNPLRYGFSRNRITNRKARIES